MPPARSQTKTPQTATSASGRPRNHNNVPKASDTPSIQKLKAALRQTRRLLAKDKLAADVRVETERRLKVVEAELFDAEAAGKARSLAVRYHKIKFFERQKVTRKIKQIKSQLAQTSSSAEKAALEAQLNELRVDLNYVIYYPPFKKYISLFPPELRAAATAPSTSRTSSITTTVSETDVARSSLRTAIRDFMITGHLPKCPDADRAHYATPWPGTRERIGGPHIDKEEEEDKFFGEDAEDAVQ